VVKKVVMVSRRKILSRSRDDLNTEQPAMQEEEEDVWYQRDKLYKDHIQEVLNKWQSIDDEIWAKIIVLERNRRVAKAYARAPVLTVNGSDDGFDGFRIGLAGFDNPMRDSKTEEVKRHIGQGCKIKMDDSGNILIKRIAKANVYVKSGDGENAVANEILKVAGGALELDKPVKLFDMKKFQQNVARELKRAYPDRRKLECQCISAVAFVKNEAELLDQACWVMLINVVAMDMLRSEIPPVKNDRSAVDIRNRPRIPVPDEDPYSVAGSGSSGSSGPGGPRSASKDKPPKLPPRDNSIYGPNHIPKPDYEQQAMEESRFRQQLEARNKAGKKNEKKHDDPYYCGLRARIPNFAKSKAQKEKEAKYGRIGDRRDKDGHPMVWHGPQRGYLENGMNLQAPPNHPDPIYAGFRSRPQDRGPPRGQHHRGGDYESDYSHIYGRLPLPYGRFRQYPSPSHPSSRQMYVSEWE